MPVVDLNNKIRELMGLERDEIDRILRELSGLVAAQAELLLQDAELAAQLDFIMAKGRLALKMKAMPPALNECRPDPAERRPSPPDSRRPGRADRF